MRVYSQFGATRIWAKTGECNGQLRYHPLVCHMQDVAAVAGKLWDHCFTQALQRRIAHSLAVESPRNLVVFVAGAHDIGKASPSFQKKSPELCRLFDLPISQFTADCPHGLVSTVILQKWLGDTDLARLVARISGAHHGLFPLARDLECGPDTLGDGNWDRVRSALLNQLAADTGFDSAILTECRTQLKDPYAVPVLAGFISVADWIASNQAFFPCCADPDTPDSLDSSSYWNTAQDQALHALEALGWLPTVGFAPEAPFDAVFPTLKPNALQATALDIATRQDRPYLMIVEAPMGQGKTEAALYAADLAMCRGFARGLYVAMPTQATSNAMFHRVLDDYLRERGHSGRLNVQLVHGDALLTNFASTREGEVADFRPASVDGGGEDLNAHAWFTAKKRPLLAPFGVGTIDQALLSVLKTKHWFVCLFGLAGKVIIFDEVHAYDAYMSTILERLLGWLAELDCTVILLSATLPDAKRQSLARAYGGAQGGEYAAYPRVTVAKPQQRAYAQRMDQPCAAAIPMERSRAVELTIAPADPDALAKTLAQRLEHGGCAAVICNTVDRAIEVYDILRSSLIDTECLLFHARTLQGWRRQRESEVLLKFGKQGRRPVRAVLVATQVVEQSLDLDFDLMVSELAPIDLLLQRLGRLQRHPRLRPRGLDTPSFILLCDAERTGPPPDTFGRANEAIYDRYVLLKTWHVLRNRSELDVPREIEALVEAVYGDAVAPADLAWEAAITEAYDDLQFNIGESEKAARKLLIAKPAEPLDLVEQFNDQLLDDDDPAVHKTVRAATRQGDPAITVVFTDAESPVQHTPDLSEIRNLLSRSAKISHRGLYPLLRDHGLSPPEWARTAHLRHARLLTLDAQDQTSIGDFVLIVDDDAGIRIIN